MTVGFHSETHLFWGDWIQNTINAQELDIHHEQVGVRSAAPTREFEAVVSAHLVGFEIYVLVRVVVPLPLLLIRAIILPAVNPRRRRAHE